MSKFIKNIEFHFSEYFELFLKCVEYLSYKLNDFSIFEYYFEEVQQT